MRILVTGANGFVGRHLVNELIKHDIEIVGIGGRSASADKTLSDKMVEYLTLDLNDANTAHQINFTNIDGVVHLAGLAAVGPSFEEPMRYISSNIGMQLNLYEAALKQNARPKFLIVSTGALYDASEALPLQETSHVLPSSPYAVSKLGQEELAAYYSLRGFPVIIARPFNHVGPGQGTGFIVPNLVKQVVAFEKHQLDTLLVGNLSAARDYTDVRDIAVAYRLLLDKGVAGETYNICSGTHTTGREILDIICSSSHVNPPTEQDKSIFRPVDIPVIFGDHQKLTKDTGWVPIISFNDTVEDVLDEWRSTL